MLYRKSRRQSSTPFILLTIGVIVGFLLIARRLQAQTANQVDPNSVVALQPISNIIQVATGFRHTCALTNAGAVRCWGSNQFGELGDGTFKNHNIPANVSGLNSGITAVATGYAHSCALTDIGGVKCWGQNYSGQLGDGSNISRTIPVDVIGLTSGVTAISAGGHYTCALTNTATVKCWGTNSYGELGNDSGVHSYTPVNVTNLSKVVAISASYVHICALTTSGAVKCWGNNRFGQLGDGSTVDRHTPVDVISLSSGVNAVSTGWNHTCALTGDSGVKCWGQNNYGQVGDGTKIERRTPVNVFSLTSDVAKITTGWNYSCVVMNYGGVKCWGANTTGEIGDGSTIDRYTPVDVTNLTSGITAISANSEHTCALTDSTGIKCWGHNYTGQLGDGTNTDRYTPVNGHGSRYSGELD